MTSKTADELQARLDSWSTADGVTAALFVARDAIAALREATRPGAVSGGEVDERAEVNGGPACPICNTDTPHEHDARTIAAWRSVSKRHGKPFASYEQRLRLWLVYGSDAAEALGIGATVESAWWSAYRVGENPLGYQGLRSGEARLPAWWPQFIRNMAEIPDRTSPDDEPEAMVATASELERCALRAIEDSPPPAGDAP